MNIYKKLPIVTVVLFLLGILITVIYLFNLPEQLSAILPIDSKWNKVAGVFYNLYVIVGIELALGAAAIILLMGKGKAGDDIKIVYVDKYTSKKEVEEKAEEETRTEDFAATIESRVKNVKSILSTKGDAKKTLDKALSSVCNLVEASQGAIFLRAEQDGKRVVRLFSSFAYSVAESATVEYEYGEGLTGQAAKEGKLVKIEAVPEGYIQIFSGLGKATPSNLVFIPIKNKEECIGVVEISSFKKLERIDEEFLNKLSPVFSEFIVNQKNLSTVEI